MKSYAPYSATFAVIGVIGVATLNQTAIAKQLDNWQILPRPEGATELFFNDPTRLPEALRLNTQHNIAFTLHNLEHVQTIYRYKISAVSGNNKEGVHLKDNTVTLNHDQYHSTAEVINIPALGSPIALQVDIEYPEVGDNGQLNNQRQSIRHWVKVVGLPS